jgi:hypothetical protein
VQEFICQLLTPLGGFLMKAIFALLTISAAAVSANAWGLESHYGTPVKRGHIYTCAYKNTTGATQDMKYVVFSFETLGHGGNDVVTQIRIDKTVAAGETLSASTSGIHTVNVNFCKYLAR